YSGKGGVCSNGRQSGSMCLLITVSGRTRLLLYFSCQQLMNASCNVMATIVCTNTAESSGSSALILAMPAMPIQCPPGEIFFSPIAMCPENLTAKGLQSQKLAMSFCSSVRFLPVSYTSIACRKNELVVSMLYSVGGGGANCSADSRKNGLTVAHCGSTASMKTGGVGYQYCSPFSGV